MTVMRVMRLSDIAASVVEIYCVDVAFDGAFPGSLRDGSLTFAQADAEAVAEWLMDVGNGLDDELEGKAGKKPRLDERQQVRALRNAAYRLSSRAREMAEGPTPGGWRI